MARITNIYVLLKNLEAFVKSVPINPKARNYKDWIKCRVEMKKALKDMNKMLKTLESLEDIEKRLAPVLLVPCRGRVPLKQILEAILVPCRKVPIRNVVPMRLCGKVPQRQV